MALSCGLLALVPLLEWRCPVGWGSARCALAALSTQHFAPSTQPQAVATALGATALGLGS